jgi:hypothetical protein
VFDKSFNQLRERLMEATLQERARAQLNLTFGVGLSVAAVVTLIACVMTLSNPADFRYTALYLTARLPVVILVEVVAFFFVRLYKSSLSDIKY